MDFRKPRLELDYKNLKIFSKVEQRAEIFFIERTKEARIYDYLDSSNIVLFSRRKNTHKIFEIYIRHPFKSKIIQLEYQDSFYFKFAEALLTYETRYSRAPVSIFVNNHKIISYAVSGNSFHEKHGCIRKKNGIVSGQYEICPGCHPRNHSEVKAIKKAKAKGVYELLNSSVDYLYNHWWACEYCDKYMREAGVKKIIFSKTWTRNFLKIKSYDKFTLENI